jgi:hypothetical protein
MGRASREQPRRGCIRAKQQGHIRRLQQRREPCDGQSLHPLPARECIDVWTPRRVLTAPQLLHVRRKPRKRFVREHAVGILQQPGRHGDEREIRDDIRARCTDRCDSRLDVRIGHGPAWSISEFDPPPKWVKKTSSPWAMTSTPAASARVSPSRRTALNPRGRSARYGRRLLAPCGNAEWSATSSAER